jgi:hypothetical protein
MKKLLLILSLVLATGVLFAQTDTITGWTFPTTGGADSLNANLGTSTNMGYDLRFQWVGTTSDSTVDVVMFVDGATTYAAACQQWDNGADAKYWSIKFKAPGYENIKVSSKQRGNYEGFTAGPKDFKLQWKLSGGEWADINGGTVTVANDWTTSVVSDLAVPVTGQGSTSVYIRWLQTSNTDINGGTVAVTGISMIDDILVVGTAPSGTEDIIFTKRVQIYPVPNHGKFTIESKVAVNSFEITDLSGRTIYVNHTTGTRFPIDLGSVSRGTYLLKVGFTDSDKPYTMKFVVD